MTDAGPPGPIHPLNYEPANPRRRRWRLVRRIVLWALVLAVGGAVFVFRTELWLRTRRAYWLYECMHHVTPPGTVLEEDDPAKAAKLLAANPDYVQEVSYDALILKDPSKVPPLPPTAVYCPKAFRGLLSTDPKHYAPLPGDAIAFMGERTSPAGHRRLIVIPHTGLDWHDFESVPDNFSWVIAPTSFLGSGPANWSAGLGTYMLGHSWGFVPVSLKPGLADPKDLSHFTIDYVDASPHPAFHGTFDIYLKDDDTLSVKAIEAH